MRTALKTFFLGTSLAVSSMAVQAQESFVGLTWGETSNTIHRSTSLKAHPAGGHLDRAINYSSGWGIRGGQQSRDGRWYLSYDHVSDSRQGYRLRQQSVLASYDAFLPIADTTRLFGGLSAGLVQLDQKSRGFRSDSDIGVAGGFQLGILQELGANASVEAGYRYLRTSASADVKARDNSLRSSLSLDSTKLGYIGVNYRF